MQYIAKVHAIHIGQPAGACDMPLQIDNPLAIGQDRFNANAIPILYLKRRDGISISLRALIAGKIQRDRLALAVGIDTLDDDVAERSCNRKATSVIEECSQRRL